VPIKPHDITAFLYTIIFLFTDMFDSQDTHLVNVSSELEVLSDLQF
jgi:hypothetical protein